MPGVGAGAVVMFCAVRGPSLDCGETKYMPTKSKAKIPTRAMRPPRAKPASLVPGVRAPSVLVEPFPDAMTEHKCRQYGQYAVEQEVFGEVRA
jgi:hypothetical protein